MSFYSPEPAAVLTPPAAPKKWLPSGKGMWIYLPDKTEGGNVASGLASCASISRLGWGRT